MAIAQRTVNYAQEIDLVLSIVVDLITKAKAGESVIQIGSEEIGQLISAVAQVSQVPIELADRKTVLETIGYRIGDIADALL